MNCLEFYIFEDELWVLSPNGNEKVTEDKTLFVKEILDRVRECYPKAYEALCENYIKSQYNVPYYQYLMASRFCRCNFGELDSSKKDVDVNGGFNFEKVKCPLRGECKYEGIICCPEFNSKLSDAELRVMRLLYDGLTVKEVADKLYLSVHTVQNHYKRVYCKLRIHSLPEFIRYANQNGLFQ